MILTQLCRSVSCMTDNEYDKRLAQNNEWLRRHSIVDAFGALQADDLMGAVDAARLRDRMDAITYHDDQVTIAALRAEWSDDLPEWHKEGIRNKLASLGTVVYPPGSPEYVAYEAKLKAALAEWSQGKIS